MKRGSAQTSDGLLEGEECVCTQASPLRDGTAKQRAAIFLDRDGTLIEDTGYVANAEKVRLLPGVPESLRRLKSAGFYLIVATNQSGVARGLISEEEVERIHERIQALLPGDARVDAFYTCPFLEGEEAVVAAYRRASPLRKPAPGMLLAAAREMGLDLSRSWMIGDSQRDVAAGRAAGCRTILLTPPEVDPPRPRSGAPPPTGGAGKIDRDAEAADHGAASLVEAAAIVEELMEEQSPLGPDSEEKAPDRAVASLLRDIRDRLDKALRREQQADFSLMRLAAVLLQMFALLACVWGGLAYMNSDPLGASARWALATFLQLASLTAVVSERLK